MVNEFTVYGALIKSKQHRVMCYGFIMSAPYVFLHVITIM